MSRHLLIRSDGGWIQTTRGLEAIASGHLMRMLVVAKNWRSRYGPVTLLVNQSCRGIDTFLDRYQKVGCETKITQSQHCNSIFDAEETASLARKLNAPIYLDGYHFGSKYQAHVRSKSSFLIVQDDNCDQGPYKADLIIGGHVHATDLKYANAPGARLLLGPQYALISPEMISSHHSRIAPKVGSRLLISLGSQDRYSDTGRCLQGLLRFGSNEIRVSWLRSLEIAVVTGANHSDLETIKILAQQLQRAGCFQVSLYHDLDNLSELMNWAEFALSAAGGTVLELIFMGVPTVLQISHVNQRPIAAKLIELGLVLFAGDSTVEPARPENETEDQIVNQLFNLAHHQIQRRQMIEKDFLTVDGKGAERICATIALENEALEDHALIAIS